MLSLLLDEHLSAEVARQIKAKREEIVIESVQTWREGVLCGASDDQVLRVAREAGLTLVSYDVNTITPLLIEWAARGEQHGGVIFLDRHAVAQSDFGGQFRALLSHWETTHSWDWTDRVDFLRPVL